MRARISVVVLFGRVPSSPFKTERGRCCCSEEYVSHERGYKVSSHTDCVRLLFVGLSKKRGRIDLASERASRYFSSCFAFSFFGWFVETVLKKSRLYIEDLSLSLDKYVKSLLFVFFCLAACACCSLVLFFGTPPTLVGTLGWCIKTKRRAPSVSVSLSLSLSRTQHARTSDIREQSMRVSERARENEKKTSGTRNGDFDWCENGSPPPKPRTRTKRRRRFISSRHETSASCLSILVDSREEH